MYPDVWILVDSRSSHVDKHDESTPLTSPTYSAHILMGMLCLYTHGCVLLIYSWVWPTHIFMGVTCLYTQGCELSIYSWVWAALHRRMGVNYPYTHKCELYIYSWVWHAHILMNMSYPYTHGCALPIYSSVWGHLLEWVVLPRATTLKKTISPSHRNHQISIVPK